jgi:WD40 repeat protein
VTTCSAHPHAVLSASWDKTLAVWDTRQPATAPPVTSVALPGRATALDLRWPTAAVATAGEAGVSLIDLRAAPATPTPAGLHSTIDRLPPRTVALFPRGDGVCVGTFEGRVGVQFLRPGAAPTPGDDFSFKCHRQGTDKQRVYAVGALAFVPGRPHVLITAGTDGECCAWDIQKRNKSGVLLKPGPAAPGTSAGGPEPVGLPALAFSPGGDMMAYARSDDWSGGQPLYDVARAAGHADDVRILLLSRARLAAWDAA